jgi:D-alanyl-D-alanine carboxypeptidase
MVLAENIGGSEDEFARMMTSRARSLGMMNTHFNNPNGLPDDGQLTTARDMAILAQALIQRFPKYYRYFATSNFTYKGINHPNHNHLMERYQGMDGIKTGFIRASGFNLTASAVRDKHRLIAVVFGGTSARSRDDYMAGLLDDGFRRIAGQPGPAEMSAAFGAVTPPPEKPSEGTGEIAGVPLAEAGDAVESGEGSPAPAQAIVAQPVEAPAAPAPQVTAQAQPTKELPALSVPAEMLDVSPAKPSARPVVTAQGDADADAVDNDEAAATPHVLRVPKHRVSYAPSDSATTKWGVRIGTYSSRTASDKVLQKAVATLPVDMRDDATPVSIALKIHKKRAFAAELTGLNELQAKRACSVLTHCTPIKS